MAGQDGFAYPARQVGRHEAWHPPCEDLPSACSKDGAVADSMCSFIIGFCRSPYWVCAMVAVRRVWRAASSFASRSAKICSARPSSLSFGVM